MASIPDPKVVIRGICEQDIDLLLLEEIVSCPEFRSWFLEKLGLRPDAVVLGAERSVATVTGESDIELTLLAGDETIMVLIENKVDAPLQPSQAERYRERALAYQTGGICKRVITAVVAPEIYFDADAKHGFDVFVQYESVLAWFESASSLGPRRGYKVALMRQAIERGRRGWTLVPDETTTNFWRQYWEMAEEIAPELRMREPAVKSATSSFIPFWPLSLPADVALLHKVPYGRVDLQFAGMGSKLDVLQKKYAKYMSKVMKVEKAGKSGAIRICVEDIDMQVPFDESRPQVKTALDAAVLLLQMYEAANAP